ncbi:MAG: universal stress protein [Bryobacteraceae bacterium]|nr:universal stress protein [Bryobacteraceae bacterium]
MLRFDTILFPTDFSGRCAGAARYVKALSARFDSTVILLHVVEARIGQPGDPQFGGVLLEPWLDLEVRAKEQLSEYLKDVLSGPKVQRWVVRGTAAAEILNTARQQHADLVVIPSHGYGAFRRLLFGSTASSLLHRCSCPVLTGAHMDEIAVPEDSLQINRILCPLDLTAASERVLLAAAELAASFSASLTLIHAVPGTDAMPERQMDCELRGHLIAQAREQMIALTIKHGIDSAIVAEAGDVADVVEAAVTKYGSQLVVIGRNGQHPWWEHNSYAIARQAPCAVLAI